MPDRTHPDFKNTRLYAIGVTTGDNAPQFAAQASAQRVVTAALLDLR